jgi:excisionase family DNA binding protein
MRTKRTDQIEALEALEILNDNSKLSMTVPEAGAVVGLNKNGSYAAADRGEIPTVRFGRLRFVPKAAFRKKLQSDGVL